MSGMWTFQVMLLAPSPATKEEQHKEPRVGIATRMQFCGRYDEYLQAVPRARVGHGRHVGGAPPYEVLRTYLVRRRQAVSERRARTRPLLHAHSGRFRPARAGRAGNGGPRAGGLRVLGERG